MPSAKHPAREAERLAALHQCAILDTPPEPAFDDLTGLAAEICEVPVALVSLVDAERQWFKSCIGLDVRETSRDVAFCAYAILSDEPLIIEDATKDPRTQDNALVTGAPHIRFYAGVPLRSADGHALGTLCVIDFRPRTLSKSVLDDLVRLARQVTIQLDLRRNLREVTRLTDLLSRTGTIARIGGWEFDIACESLTWSDEVYRIHELEPGTPVSVAEAVEFYAPECRATIERAVGRGISHGEPWDLELALVTAKGRRIWVRAQGELVSADGKPHRLCGTFQDVTERKLMETAIRASEERVRLAADVSELGVWDWDLRTNAVVWDARMFAFYGAPRTQDGVIEYETWARTLVSEEVRREQETILEDTIARVGRSEREFTVRRLDNGQLRRIYAAEQVVTDADGVPIRMVGVNRDVTEKREAEAALRASEERFRTLALNAPVGIFQTDPSGSCLYVNETWSRLTGQSLVDALGDGWTDALHPDDQIRVAHLWDAFVRGEREFANEYRFAHRNGSEVWVSGRATPMTDKDGVLVGYIGTVENITERKRAEKQLVWSATHDTLTGLPNRVLLLDRLGQCIARHRRNRKRHFAVLFLDFDRFKLVNDSLGHEAGDELLRKIADRLRAIVRPADTVANDRGDLAGRLGGDEFVVILDELATPEDATVVADRLLETFSEPCRIGEHEVVSTVSIGVVTSATTEGDADQVLGDADTAMYEAKLAGKGRYVEFDGAMRERVRRRLVLEEMLRGAIARNELSVAYQPVVEMDTGRCDSVEALVRWNHAEQGSIPPLEFVPVAEETGLIMELGEFVFRQACADFVKWRDELGSLAPSTISVNLSRSQLAVSDLATRFRVIVEEIGLRPADVRLEVTENDVVDARSDVRPALHRLKEAGFGLAMDDFGTGLSSLSGLHELPIDVIKIDRSFIVNFVSGRQFLALTQSVTELARNLGLLTVAEGIDSPEQVAALQALGCDYGQGFFFARPMSSEDLMEQLREPGERGAA